MTVPFPITLIKQIACRGQGYEGIVDPNGTQLGNRFDIYFQRNDPDDGFLVIWIKRSDGGNQDWV